MARTVMLAPLTPLVGAVGVPLMLPLLLSPMPAGQVPAEVVQV